MSKIITGSNPTDEIRNMDDLSARQLKRAVEKLASYLEGMSSIGEHFCEEMEEAMDCTLSEALIDHCVDLKFTVGEDLSLDDFHMTTAVCEPPLVWCDAKHVYGKCGSCFLQEPYQDKIGLFFAMEAKFRSLAWPDANEQDAESDEPQP